MHRSHSEKQPDELPTMSTTLLDGVREMQPESWSRLVEVFGPIVYRWCRRGGVSEEDAADLVQEVFASVARAIPQFERMQERGSFRSWLATITRNAVRDHYRRLQKQPQASGGTEAHFRWLQLEEAMDESTSHTTTQGLVSRRILQLVRSEFEERTWQAFWLTTIEGRLPVDVAAELEMSLSSVYQAKSRVLRRLRQRLAELPG